MPKGGVDWFGPPWSKIDIGRHNRTVCLCLYFYFFNFVFFVYLYHIGWIGEAPHGPRLILGATIKLKTEKCSCCIGG